MDRGRTARGFKQVCEFVAHLLAVHGTATDGARRLRVRVDAHFLDRVAGEPGHGDGSGAVRVLVVPGEGLMGHEAKFGTDFLEALDGAPEPMADEGARAEAFDEVEGHIELVADLAVKLGRGVGDGEEDDGEGGDEEVVEAYLLRAVDVAYFVQAGEHSDSIFGHLNGLLSVKAVSHDTGCGKEDRAVDEDTHLVCADVQEDTEAEVCT